MTHTTGEPIGSDGPVGSPSPPRELCIYVECGIRGPHGHPPSGMTEEERQELEAIYRVPHVIGCQSLVHNGPCTVAARAPDPGDGPSAVAPTMAESLLAEAFAGDAFETNARPEDFAWARRMLARSPRLAALLALDDLAVRERLHTALSGLYDKADVVWRDDLTDAILAALLASPEQVAPPEPTLDALTEAFHAYNVAVYEGCFHEGDWVNCRNSALGLSKFLPAAPPEPGTWVKEADE